MPENVTVVKLPLRNTVLDDVAYLKTALGIASEAATVNDAIEITRQLVRVVSSGGEVIIKPSKGEARQLVLPGVQFAE